MSPECYNIQANVITYNMLSTYRRSPAGAGWVLCSLSLLTDLVSVLCLPVPEFTEQPSQLQGYSIHTRLSKGPRGFGFNIVGGTRPREFLQVYSVTPGGPPALNTGARG